jgi:hypothetical protein
LASRVRRRQHPVRENASPVTTNPVRPYPATFAWATNFADGPPNRWPVPERPIAIQLCTCTGAWSIAPRSARRRHRCCNLEKRGDWDHEQANRRNPDEAERAQHPDERRRHHPATRTLTTAREWPASRTPAPRTRRQSAPRPRWIREHSDRTRSVPVLASTRSTPAYPTSNLYRRNSLREVSRPAA